MGVAEERKTDFFLFLKSASEHVVGRGSIKLHVTITILKGSAEGLQGIMNKNSNCELKH